MSSMEPTVKTLLFSFFEKFGLRSFPKGAVAIKPEDRRIFFLTKGVVRMGGTSKEKNPITLNIYKAYALFPLSLLFKTKDTYTFDCLTKVEGYFAPQKDFETFLKQHPAVLFDVLRRIYQGFDGFFLLFAALLSKDAYYRVLTQLVIHARRFGKKDQNRITFDWHITHDQLASQTGLARESVTREIKKLQKKMIVGYSGKKLFIFNLDKLEDECFSFRDSKMIP